MNLWVMLLVATVQVAIANNGSQLLLESKDVIGKTQRLLELENEVRELRKMRSMLASELQSQNAEFAGTILNSSITSSAGLAMASSEVPFPTRIFDIIWSIMFELFILMPLGALMYLGSSAVFLPSMKPRQKSEVLQTKAGFKAACPSQMCAEAIKGDDLQSVHFQRGSLHRRKYARTCSSDAEGRCEFASTNARKVQDPKTFAKYSHANNRWNGSWQSSHVSDMTWNGHIASVNFEKRQEAVPFASLLSQDTAAEISRNAQWQPFNKPGCSRA